jgi:two-component system cell cycle response regulator
LTARRAEKDLMQRLEVVRSAAAGPLASVARGVREIASNVPLALRIPVIAGLLLLAAVLAGVPGTAWAAHGDWLYNGLEFAAPVLCVVRAIRKPRERAVWILFALGTTSYAMGNLYWALVLADDADAPFPSPADGLWLGLYPCLFAALWLLARARLRGINHRVWLDGLIVGLGLAALSASVVFRQVAATTEGDAWTIVTNLAYPAADLLALILIAVLFSATRTLVDRTCQTLAAGIGVFLVTDSIYLVQIADGTYALNTMLDLGWPLGVVLIGIAAWQPGSRGRVRAESSITLPTVLAGLCVALMVYDHFSRVETLGVVLAAATLAAAVCRLVLTYRASAQLMRTTQRAATTDELTQLGNRAKLLSDLGDVLDGERNTLLAFFDLDGFKNYNDSYGHPAGDALLHRLATRLARAMPAGGEAYRLGGDEFCALIPWHDTAEVTDVLAPACAALFEQGEGFSVTTSWGHVIVPAEASTTSQALSIADHRLYEDKSDGRISARRESQQVLKRVLEQRDHALGIHIDEVATLAERTAVELGLEEAAVEQVVLAAELHDIGKSAIPDAILFKAGPLNADEWAFMRRHTVIGERIIAGAPSLTSIARIVRSSHERFDGTGYPDGLAGDAIPLAARIVFVCDAFDAMTSNRSYRAPMAAEPALAELRACAGSQFDPVVVDAFARVQARARVLAA